MSARTTEEPALEIRKKIFALPLLLFTVIAPACGDEQAPTADGTELAASVPQHDDR